VISKVMWSRRFRRFIVTTKPSISSGRESQLTSNVMGIRLFATTSLLPQNGAHHFLTRLRRRLRSPFTTRLSSKAQSFSSSSGHEPSEEDLKLQQQLEHLAKKFPQFFIKRDGSLEFCVGSADTSPEAKEAEMHLMRIMEKLVDTLERKHLVPSGSLS